MRRRPQSAVERSQQARRESRTLDFKECFDPEVDGDWLELIKDFAAMANSGGGLIVVGVRDDGSPARQDVTSILRLDSAKITDKVERYTGVQFADFEITEGMRGSKKIALIEVGPASAAPIAFAKPGTYQDPSEKKKQKAAFSRGSVYFRHGTKSEPGTTADFRAFVDRRLDEMRELWLGRMRQVIEAPEAVRVALVQSVDEGGAPARIRLTDDPAALVYGKLDPDDTHPYRQKELIEALNARLPGDAQVNPHDVLSVRRVHDIREATRPEYTHEPRYGSPQYSQLFADWLVEQFERDHGFFWKAREKYAERL